MEFKIIEDVMTLANLVHESSNHVYISNQGLYDVANMMKDHPLENEIKSRDILNIISRNIDARAEVLKELVADSINYCYWIGRSNIRPNDASSNTMRRILDKSFNAVAALSSTAELKIQLRSFHRALVRERFPLMDKRLVHLNALARQDYFTPATSRKSYRGEPVAFQMVDFVMEKRKFDSAFDFLVTRIDGFGDDPFLKRAILFFLQLNRIFGIYNDEIKQLPIPADYQVPKMLEHYKVLIYSNEIKDMINNGIHFQENSLEEMTIRAATLIATKEIGELTGMSPAEVDEWFFIRRKECNNPFHLCITSNY